MTKVVNMVTDGLRNLISGVGGPHDKTTGWQYSVFVPMDMNQINQMYMQDWLAAKIIDIPAFDMCREWRTWQHDKAEDFYREEGKLRMRTRVRRARVLSRLHGGAAIYISTGDNGRTELRPDRMQKGGIKYLHVLSSLELSGEGQIIDDINSPWYGQYEFYRVKSKRGSTLSQDLFHRSRFAFFKGLEIPNEMHEAYLGWWGLPVLERVRQAVVNVGATALNSAALTEEAKIDIIKIPNLMDYVSTADSRNRLMDRFTIAKTLKSMVNMLLIGGDEEFDRREINFGGLPQLIQEHKEIAAGAADIPMTRLFGRAPAGMNATGESDMRNYYDNLHAQQEDMMEELEPLDELFIRHVLGSRPLEAAYEWNPLWQMSEKEKAETDKINADLVAVYVNTGLLMQEELRPAVLDKLIEQETFPTIDQYRMSEEDFFAEKEAEEEAEIEKQGALAEVTAQAKGNVTPFRKKAANDGTDDDDIEFIGQPRSLIGSRRPGSFTAGGRWHKNKAFGRKRANPFGDESSSDHLPGQHEQKSHGRGGGGKSKSTRTQGGSEHGNQTNPAVSLFDKVVAQEGIPTGPEFMKTLKPEQQAAIAVGLRRDNKTPNTVDVYKGADGKYTPERQKVHREILRKLFTKEAIEAARPPEGEKPTMTLLGGRGGSGKSWLTGEEGPAGKRKAITINPDDFKEALPGYKGYNAGSFHAESGDLNSMASKIARRLKVNVVHDATMKTASSTRETAEAYLKDGYRLEGHYMFASPKTAARRAVERFMRVGRLVPPTYSLSSLTNEATFDSLIPKFANWSVYSNNVDGAKPVLIAKKRGVKDEDFEDDDDLWAFYNELMDEQDHLPGKHEQKTHGSGGGGESGAALKLEGGKLGDLTKHTAMRDYKKGELDWEYEREYKVYTKPHFPNAFSSREDFQTKVDGAPLVHFSIERFRTLGNSMAASGYNKGEKWVHDTFGHRRDSKAIIKELKEGLTSPPIVLHKNGRDWLMAGQTRLASGLALGRSVPVKLIDVGAKKDEDFDDHLPGQHEQKKHGSGGGRETNLERIKEMAKPGPDNRLIMTSYSGNEKKLAEFLDDMPVDEFLERMGATEKNAAVSVKFEGKIATFNYDTRARVIPGKHFVEPEKRIWWERSFDTETKTVHHENFVVAEKGHGIGKKVLSSQVKLYQDLGYEKVDLPIAVSVGSYAWAKYGFVAKKGEKDGWDDLKPQLSDKVKKAGLQGERASAVNKLLTMNDGRAVWAIADMPGGKDLLMNTRWSGELNFSDKQAMQRFNAYVGT